jgi:predicted DNA-binding transcriptional regulator AlpA
MSASVTSLRSLQSRYGFNVPLIEQFRQLALASRPLPVTAALVAIRSAGAMLAPAMLKRADGSLQAFTGLSYSTIFRMETAGRFPARRQLSPRRVGYLRSEVEAWLLAGEKVQS